MKKIKLINKLIVFRFLHNGKEIVKEVIKNPEVVETATNSVGALLGVSSSVTAAPSPSHEQQFRTVMQELQQSNAIHSTSPTTSVAQSSTSATTTTVVQSQSMLKQGLNYLHAITTSNLPKVYVASASSAEITKSNPLYTNTTTTDTGEQLLISPDNQGVVLLRATNLKHIENIPKESRTFLQNEIYSAAKTGHPVAIAYKLITDDNGDLVMTNIQFVGNQSTSGNSVDNSNDLKGAKIPAIPTGVRNEIDNEHGPTFTNLAFISSQLLIDSRTMSIEDFKEYGFVEHPANKSSEVSGTSENGKATAKADIIKAISQSSKKHYSTVDEYVPLVLQSSDKTTKEFLEGIVQNNTKETYAHPPLKISVASNLENSID